MAGSISIGTMGTITGTIIIIATKPGERGVVERAGKTQKKRGIERGSKTIRAFSLRNFFRRQGQKQIAKRR